MRAIMSECMQTDSLNMKPRIAMLMAIYEPNLKWLEEQLISLNEQSYSNLYLYIREDCSPAVPFSEIEGRVKKCITAFPYEIKRNAQNLGSNGTFELLTAEAEGDYFAYCDQDDVWLPEKLEVLQRAAEQSNALLICSDMYIIDGKGGKLADSITAVRRHHVFRSGEGLADGLLFRNFVTGCTMLVNAEMAKKAAPFCPYMVHDHYLALFAANSGEIVNLPDRLIKYRIHGNNQTEIMAGVADKASYERVRIDKALKKMLWLKENLSCGNHLQEVIQQGISWLEARQRNWRRQGGAGTVWKYRQFGALTVLFEIFAPYLPNGMFDLAIKMMKKNLL